MSNPNCEKIKNQGVGYKASLFNGGAFFGVSSQFPQKPYPVFLTAGVGMEKKCLRCEDFLRHIDHEKAEEILFNQAGIWDYKTCHATCWQENRLKYEKAQDNYYRENKAYLKTRRVLCTA